MCPWKIMEVVVERGLERLSGYLAGYYSQRTSVTAGGCAHVYAQ